MAFLSRAYWLTAPGHGEIRSAVLAGPGRRRRAGARHRQRDQPRHREPGVSWPRTGQRISDDALSVSGRRFPGAGEIRLCLGRRGRDRARSSAQSPRLLPLPASGSLRRAGRCRGAGARQCPRPARDARREYGDRAQRDVGCRAASGRSHRRHRRRRGRLLHRIAGGEAARHARRADRHRSTPRRDRRGAGMPLCLARARRAAIAISFSMPAPATPASPPRCALPASRPR